MLFVGFFEFPLSEDEKEKDLLKMIIKTILGIETVYIVIAIAIALIVIIAIIAIVIKCCCMCRKSRCCYY